MASTAGCDARGMRHFPIVSLGLIASLALLSASCSPPWTVIVKSGPPSALAAVQQFSVAADRSQMMVGDHSLNDELANRDPEEQQALLEAIAGMETSFAAGFSAQSRMPTLPATTAPMPNEARITIRWTYVDPGKYVFVYARDSVITARILFTVGATVVDEIEITRSVDANRRQGSIVERLNIGGDTIGRLAGKYVAQVRAGG
ncbi:MAG: hypothetical protein DRJ42_18425 [Deltaproteobacteria bacterium]|nr:MAG: hypothetical protein DRJ42_18425 [Deltaproteobacteria bacterium]